RPVRSAWCCIPNSRRRLPADTFMHAAVIKAIPQPALGHLGAFRHVFGTAWLPRLVPASVIASRGSKSYDQAASGLKRKAPAMPRYLSKLALYPLVASLPALGLLLALSPPAGASTASHASPHARDIAAAIAALKHLKVGDHATNHAVGHR